jgi:CBS domain-containing protein
MSFLSQVRGRPVFDADGARIGTLRDLLIATESPYPPVTAVVVGDSAGLHSVPWSAVASVTPRGAALKRRYKLASFPPPLDDLIWLGRDVLDKQIVDTTGAKLVRVNDVALTQVDTDLRVAGVDNSTQGLFRRIGLDRIVPTRGVPRLIDWEQVDISPALGEIRLRVPYNRLQRMHPADIAEVVSHMSPAEAADVLEALDDETAARAMAELPEEHQAAVLTAMEPEEAADMLDEMEPDEAADVLGDVREERAEELMALMEPAAADEVRTLLAYPEDTAGGLMNSNVVTVPEGATLAETTAAVRRASGEGDEVSQVYVLDADDRVIGQISLAVVLVNPPGVSVASVMQRDIYTVRIDDADEEVARMLVHYGLLSVAVVDEEHRMKGEVTIADVIDLFAPRAWRSRPRRVHA